MSRASGGDCKRYTQECPGLTVGVVAPEHPSGDDETDATDSEPAARDGAEPAAAEGGGPAVPDGEPSPNRDDETPDIDLTELTLKERIVLATAQQPAIALLIIILFLFAFTFLIALAMIFPAIAAMFIFGTVALTGLAVGVFLLLRRLES